MAKGEAEAVRGAEVEDVHRVPGQAEPLGEALDDAGQPLEGVREAVQDHTEAAVRALLRGAEPSAAALRGLTGAPRAAPAARELAWDGAAVTAASRRFGPLGVRLAAQLAEAAADLLTDPMIGRLKEREADDCVMLFLPAHPHRRWCSAGCCGNRARVAHYYRRHGKPADGEG
ncbi:CGNR zinc finger domain-containing protein [Streptomyces sp. TRM76323]|uniref:CGNR zinc finger domain-containing protein n=1 Tax=Streptomyces tamarix TaxID=3078565 RepID=A0ABU3QSZ2_9ACTN|nr:CGNR zinc finger domain-containing protein [Streptomyces tamarix]MDT9685906.1 CGNR zinc finger domain-containing protein [Streptomyces tamarix]